MPPVLPKQSTGPVPENERAQNRGTLYKDAVLFVYTSGTTGMPKVCLCLLVRDTCSNVVMARVQTALC